jgi:propanol-preferring alcohol dehydrogenase
MLGKHCDGGYAEHIAVPARNAVHLPPEIPFEHGATMMCSSSTSFHALRKAELQPGETVAVFGAGGLGMSAIQLAWALGALQVYAVDIQETKLRLAETYGAVPVDASQRDPVAEIRRLTNGRGVDVAMEVIGLRRTMEQAVQALAVFGRAVMVGIAAESLAIDSYRHLLCKEAKVLGSADHLLWELPILIEFARQGKLDLSRVVTRTVSLDARSINEAMDALQQFGGGVRTVIVP